MKLLYTLILFQLLLLSCSTEPEDCAGFEGGGAYFDDCGICGGDNSTCTDDNVINIYQLEDLNSTSSTFGQITSHNTFLGKAILYYFPISDT